ncbi:MAG: hypothetical protein V1725_03020 [archaeon]
MSTELTLSNDNFVKQFSHQYAQAKANVEYGIEEMYNISYVHITFVEGDTVAGLSFDYIKNNPKLHILITGGKFTIKVAAQDFKTLIFKVDVHHLLLERGGYSWKLKLPNKDVYFNFFR